MKTNTNTHKKFRYITLLLLAALLSLCLIGCGEETLYSDLDHITEETIVDHSGTGTINPPPKNPTIELLAEDADLDDAPGAIIEPNSPPYNIGGWKGDSVLWYDVYIEEGDYTVGVLYSRPYGDTEVTGAIYLSPYDNNSTSWHQLIFDANSTSSDEGDWSIYTYADTMNYPTEAMSTHLEAGFYAIEISALKERDDEYFINLRSVMFVREGGDPDEEKKERTYTLADFEGWWYKSSTVEYDYAGNVFYIDAQLETYTTTDKYGNESGTQEVRYYADEDYLFMANRWAINDYHWCFGEDGNMDAIYIDYYEEEDPDYPIYYRGEAPVPPEAPSLDVTLGKWYLDGITDGNEVRILEFFEDGTYCDSAKNNGASDSFVLRIRADSGNNDYLSLKLGDDDSAYFSNDNMLICMAYYLEDVYTAFGTPQYGGSYTFIHESNIGSQQAHDSIQRFKFCDHSWRNEEEDSLRPSRNGQLSYYGRNEYGWSPEKAGTWEYEDGVLTIVWTGGYIDYTLHDLDNVEEEKCYVDNIVDGFTFPTLGKFIIEVY